ncbi:RNA polymerase [Niabella ginsenosidivorans]|uniref:RNA polymerase n=1 Tax=Niabella ginsenosidivorans TaxID=1176587 RepID=A0A1A9IA09_9BACT|nr:sigma-70 family RNA polymerase sigma factor [Niabella ginsenosidivorans]ANH83889.1 RNA polymerase [Niabella ginsenosidivorans]
MGIHDAELEGILKQCKQDSVLHKEALYKGYYGFIKSVVKRYVNDYHVTEELINDSFIKIFNNLGTFKAPDTSADVPQSFRGWVAKIASRTAIDFLRKKKMDFTDDEPSEHHFTDPNPTAVYSNEVKDILSLLDQLPDTQKTVFNLYEIEGFSHEEIARLLNISENVCRVYLSRAKNKLKTLYIKHF